VAAFQHQVSLARGLDFGARAVLADEEIAARDIYREPTAWTAAQSQLQAAAAEFTLPGRRRRRGGIR
jgi:hypothetical protein